MDGPDDRREDASGYDRDDISGRNESIKNFIIPEEFKYNDRPPCPDCKSTHVVSRGPTWVCGCCGLAFNKKARGLYRKKQDIEAPICCGKQMRPRNGIHWWCDICGRWQQKVYRRKK